MSDVVDRLLPGLVVGERVTLVVHLPEGDADVLGFVTALDDSSLTVLDRRGRVVRCARQDVSIGRRMGVALGRNPLRTPPAVLRGIAEQAGIALSTPGGSAGCYVTRISDLLAGLPFPPTVPAWGRTAEFAGVRASADGEWVVLSDASPEVAREAAWWATRQGARSVLVVTADAALAASLVSEGFSPFDACA